jgi:DNA-binding CsgD family transcriptional regulator
VFRGLALLCGGHQYDAAEWAIAKFEHSIATLDRLALGGHAFVAALALVALSRFEEAADIASVPLRVEAASTPLLLAPDRATLVLLSVLAAQGGRHTAAEAFAAAAEPVRPRTAALPFADLDWAKAASHLFEGQRSRASGDFADIAARLDQRGYVFGRATASFLGSVTELDPAAAGSTPSSRRVGGPLFEAYLAARAAVIADDPRAVELAAEELSRCHATPAAMRYLAQAARLYREAGELDESSRVRSRLLAEGAGQFSGAAEQAGREPLTSREADIVRLIAAGLSNGQIASRLVISVRTVESHINNIRRKTGASDRAGLGSLARTS